MIDPNDADLDRLLRDAFAGPVADDGFCERVIEQLPARRRRTNWPLAVGTMAGAVLSWLSLWSAPIGYGGWHDWSSGQPSSAAMALFGALMGMTLLSIGWVVVEANDRPG